MVYLFLKCDEYLAAGRLTELKRALGDPEMADLNTVELTANQADAGSLLGQASMVPFLTPRRLLIVNNYLERLDKRMAASKGADSAAHQEAAQLLAGLAHLPDTSDLVFREEKGVDKRRHLWKGFTLAGRDGPEARVDGLQTLAKRGVVTVEEQGTPDPKTLPAWLFRHAKAKDVEIDGRAVKMLTEFVGPNLRQLDSELEKLSAYARGRAITPDDVKLLVSDASEALIWDLTDALSQRDGRKAMQSLYELRRTDANPFYLLTMIARQYRIIIKVKEGMGRGLHSEHEIAKAVKESPYPVKKAMSQARAYSFDELHTVMNALLEADMAMKTGAIPDTELDLLVAGLTRRRRH